MRRVVPGLLTALALAAPASAQGPPAPDAGVVLVVDASKSMRDDDGTGRPRIEAAKDALGTLIDALPDGARVGMRVYGARVSGTGKAAGCRDTRLVAPVQPLDRPRLEQEVAALTPRGFTPIGNSLKGAAADVAGARQKTVILVSDGGDNCAPPSPCAVAREISRQGVALKIQAVGFQVDARARRQLECIAEAGGGRYVDAGDAEELGAQLRALTARALRPYLTRGVRLDPVADPDAARPARPGQYTTEVRPGAANWYAFAAGAGQTVTVSATLPNSSAGIPTQLRSELEDERAAHLDDGLATNTGNVLTVITQSGVAEANLRRPPRGSVRLGLTADAAPGQGRPYPVELAVRVTGSVHEPSGGGGGDGDGGGPSALAIAAGAIAGVLAGLVLGAAAAGARRRRAA
jgi:Ca-activated chloride channel family protein